MIFNEFFEKKNYLGGGTIRRFFQNPKILFQEGAQKDRIRYLELEQNIELVSKKPIEDTGIYEFN